MQDNVVQNRMLGFNVKSQEISNLMALDGLLKLLKIRVVQWNIDHTAGFFWHDNGQLIPKCQLLMDFTGLVKSCMNEVNFISHNPYQSALVKHN